MKRWPILFGLLLLGVSTHAAKNRPAQQPRMPWEWTDEQRIAARSDAAFARERVESYLASERGGGRIKAASVPEVNAVLVDVIDGHQHPELFLPTELFEEAVTLGLVVDDNWRGAWSKGIATAGLPSGFWEHLETLAPQYVDDLRRLHALLRNRNNHSLSAGALEQIGGEIAALTPTICRDRFDALNAARAAFGTSLDRFLYQTVAVGKAKFIHNTRPDADEQRAQARGCR